MLGITVHDAAFQVQIKNETEDSATYALGDGLPPKTVPLIMTVAPAPSASFEYSPVAACTPRG